MSTLRDRRRARRHALATWLWWFAVLAGSWAGVISIGYGLWLVVTLPWR